MNAKVLVLICALGQSHEDCQRKPINQFAVENCAGTAECYVRAMTAAGPFIDDKTYPLITFGDSPASEPWDRPRYVPSKN